MTEAENAFGGTIYCSGHGTEHIFKFGGSVAEVWRNGPPRWTRNVIKFEVWRTRGGTSPLGVAVVSFRSISTLGGKRVRNGS